MGTVRQKAVVLAALAALLAGATAAAGAPSASAQKRVVVGSQGWLFSSQDWTVPCQDAGAATDDAARGIVAVGRALTASGRPVVTTIGPDKSSVMTSRLPAGPLPVEACHREQDRALWRGAAASPSFLDLRPVLRRASGSGQVYFKKDTHWAHAGDAVYAREVARRFDPTLPLALGTTSSVAQVRGDLASVLEQPPHERVASSTTVRGRVAVTELAARDVGLTHAVRTWRARPEPGGRVLPGRTVVVGDSYSAVAVGQLAQLSEETVLVWVDSRAPLAPLLRELEAADRVVLESVERFATRFRMWRPDVVAGVERLPRRAPAAGVRG